MINPGRLRAMRQRVREVPTHADSSDEAREVPIRNSALVASVIHTSPYVAFTMKAESRFIGMDFDLDSLDRARALLVANHRSAALARSSIDDASLPIA